MQLHRPFGDLDIIVFARGELFGDGFGMRGALSRLGSGRGRLERGDGLLASGLDRRKCDRCRRRRRFVERGRRGGDGLLRSVVERPSLLAGGCRQRGRDGRLGRRLLFGETGETEQRLDRVRDVGR
ncbi:MAG: hypothetical protein ACXWKD_15735 [Caldimonas sp.]